MHDVTISVWNKFWSPYLAEGLTAAGYDVFSLGTTRRKPPCSDSRTCWSSGLLTQASFHLPSISEGLAELAIELYQTFAARHALASRCFWGWSGHHLSSFKIAKAAGIPVILETGSTHLTWRNNALKDEYAKHGAKSENALIEKLTPRVLEEYEIADFICVPNSFVAKTFELQGIPASKLTVNPYGMDFTFWSAESSHRRIDGKFIVVFAGQFMLRKGVAYLMEAWRKLALQNAELWIVGAVMNDAGKLLANIPENVRVLGGKSPTELRNIFQSSDVFILPSLEEGMARAALEAMAAGLAVIITAETGVADLVRHGKEGWIIPVKNSTAIIDSLQEASNDREATACKGKSARKRVSTYTWSAYGTRAAQFLNTFLTAKNTRA